MNSNFRRAWFAVIAMVLVANAPVHGAVTPDEAAQLKTTAGSRRAISSWTRFRSVIESS